MNDSFVFDEIDLIVDKVVKNPTTATKLKEALHGSHLAGHSGRQVLQQQRVWDDGGDDLWDNVPI